VDLHLHRVHFLVLSIVLNFIEHVLYCIVLKVVPVQLVGWLLVFCTNSGLVSLQCLDTVGWVTGTASGL